LIQPRVTATVRRNAVLTAVLVVVGLLLILLDNRGLLDAPKSVVVAATTPVAGIFNDLGDRVSGLREGGDAELRRQLEQMTAERDLLLAQNEQLKTQLQEVEQLREMLGFQQQHPDMTVVAADVVARDPQSREKYIIIDRGSDHGIQVGMAVVSPNFLVGQVTDVEPGRSRVLLIIDSGFQTGARLSLAGQEGVVYGRWQSGGRVVLRHIPVDTEIAAGEDGELVITSGKTARVPEGLIIGKVISVDKDVPRNEAECEVLPVVDFDNLQSVSVITGYPGQ
jgi:rod shape-determining protein MreC